MLDKIQQFIEKYNMIPNGSAVVCGLSGGADSVCLLVCMTVLRKQLDISVEALHVNHCLRGSESDRDEEFCRELCRRLNVKFTAVSCDVKAYANKYSLSDEEAARKLRYDAFAENSHGKLIATAHNADDNLETAILNLARGTGLRGISGIPPVRDNIIRPMLTVTRKEIECFLRQHGFSYVTDSTNLSDDYTRNKIRHCIIPVLNEINESAAETFVKSADALRSEDAFIRMEADKAYNSCFSDNTLSGISEYHPIIRKRCIARLLAENSLSYSYDRLISADYIAVNGGKIDISGDLYLVSDKKSIRLEKIPQKNDSKFISYPLKLGENRIFDNKILLAEIINEKDFHPSEIVNKKLAIYYLDYDKIIGSASLRSRRFGDKIKLYRRNVTSSIKKLINETIPTEERAELHFIEDEAGTIFGEKIGIADRIAPDSSTSNYLKITVTQI
jgi:tRNA(Ile)-lysidine synthase